MWIANSLGTHVLPSLDVSRVRRYLVDILCWSRARGLHHLSKLQSWITLKVTNDGAFKPRHRARETTWVATIALSQATRFWWRDTHCTTAVWRWLITVADRTHTRVPRSSASTHTAARVRASADWQRIARRRRRPDLDFRWEKTAGGPHHLKAPILTDREIKAQRPSGPSNSGRESHRD
jgi:hypothetical protein